MQELQLVVQPNNRVLIVPLWNWNRLSSLTAARMVRFNRTFMELKLLGRKEITDISNSFNRTFMELKYT